jgi:Flp pilus assembly protein TadD
VINPGASDAWAWLAYADMLDDQQLQEAEDAIARAIQLSPGRLDYRLRFADVSILRGRLDDARRMLTELAAVTTDRTVAERAALRLTALNRQYRER